MKLLRNPIVTGVLAVVALIVVFYQLGGAKLLQPKAAGQTPVAIATRAPGPTKSGDETSPPRAAAFAAITQQQLTATNLSLALSASQRPEREFIEARFSSWANNPVRDPFLLLHPAIGDLALAAAATNSPVRSMVLKAIWDQTDSRLAVINNRVYRIGDTLAQGYKLVRIEKDEVWIQGPLCDERLGFSGAGKGAFDTKDQAPSTVLKGTKA